MRVPGHQRKSYTWRWTAALAGLAVLTFALVMALVVTPSTHVRAEARTWTVDVATDPTVADGADPDGVLDPTAAVSVCGAAAGDCSLRGAVWRANTNAGHTGAAPNPDTINFLAGLAGSTITLADSLDLNPVDAAGTTITGPGGGGIVVTGAGAGSCFILTGTGNTIEGLVISGCGADGILVLGTSTGNTIRNNRIGTDATGAWGSANAGYGIHLLIGANGNTIGGTAAAAGNLVSGNTGFTGVLVDSDNNLIRGNVIGMDVTGTFAVPNFQGVFLTGSGNTVGGTTAGSRNLLSGNSVSGVVITGATAAGNLVQGNCIGTTTTCSIAAPNSASGVIIGALAHDNTVGGTVGGAGNTIAFNTGAGVGLTGAGNGNVVVRNVMFLNATDGILNGAPPGPVAITGCVDAGSGNVTCSGTSSGAGSSIDVYRANMALPAIPQGDLWLCNQTAGAAGVWSCTFHNPGGGSVTATERLAPASTSRFSVAAGIPAGPVATATFTPTPVTPTNTPVNTNTPVGSATPTRTATPVPGAATATPTTGPMESVTLAGNTCNPVASTYPDDTAIATIAGAVSPSTNLISIWWLDAAAGRWLGYSPQFVAQSDLTLVDRLEAIFICVSSASTWSRPLI